MEIRSKLNHVSYTINKRSNININLFNMKILSTTFNERNRSKIYSKDKYKTNKDFSLMDKSYLISSPKSSHSRRSFKSGRSSGSNNPYSYSSNKNFKVLSTKATSNANISNMSNFNTYNSYLNHINSTKHKKNNSNYQSIDTPRTFKQKELNNQNYKIRLDNYDNQEDIFKNTYLDLPQSKIKKKKNDYDYVLTQNLSRETIKAYNSINNILNSKPGILDLKAQDKPIKMSYNRKRNENTSGNSFHDLSSLSKIKNLNNLKTSPYNLNYTSRSISRNKYGINNTSRLNSSYLSPSRSRNEDLTQNYNQINDLNYLKGQDAKLKSQSNNFNISLSQSNIMSNSNSHIKYLNKENSAYISSSNIKKCSRLNIPTCETTLKSVINGYKAPESLESRLENLNKGCGRKSQLNIKVNFCSKEIKKDANINLCVNKPIVNMNSPKLKFTAKEYMNMSPTRKTMVQCNILRRYAKNKNVYKYNEMLEKYSEKSNEKK